jgi:hypothetical protein
MQNTVLHARARSPQRLLYVPYVILRLLSRLKRTDFYLSNFNLSRFLRRLRFLRRSALRAKRSKPTRRSTCLLKPGGAAPLHTCFNHMAHMLLCVMGHCILYGRLVKIVTYVLKHTNIDIDILYVFRNLIRFWLRYRNHNGRSIPIS